MFKSLLGCKCFASRSGKRKTSLSFLALFLVFALLLPVSAGAWQSECPQHYSGGKPPVIEKQGLEKKAREVCFEDFGVVHSGIARTPVWSAEHVTREGLNQAREIKRVDRFYPEPRLPKEERAELENYSKTGFDRGHMAPSANMRSRESQAESFSLANIVPQNPESNRGIWAAIESSVRFLAREQGELYVVTGPVFFGEKLKRVGGRVLVPTHIYKAVYDPKRGAAVYLVENGPLQNYVTISISELNRILGVDIFPALPLEWKQYKMRLPDVLVKSKGKNKDGVRWMYTESKGILVPFEDLLKK